MKLISPSSTLTATSSPNSGTYSARLAGVSDFGILLYLHKNPYNANNYVVEFDVKLISQEWD